MVRKAVWEGHLIRDGVGTKPYRDERPRRHLRPRELPALRPRDGNSSFTTVLEGADLWRCAEAQ